MHFINGSYTTYVNIKRKRTGHLFQGRYKAILVDRDNYLLELSRYLHLNPSPSMKLGVSLECARPSLGDWKEIEKISEIFHWNPAGSQSRPASVPTAGTECCVAVG